MHKLSIIIPVYNEDQTIAEVLRIIHKLQLIGQIQKEIVVVNDCSTDRSRKEIEEVIASFHEGKPVLINHEKNTGKGGAIHTGIQVCTGDYIIIQDADLELNPAEINLLLQKVEDKEADVVYGSRFLNEKVKGGTRLSNMANGFLTWLSNKTFGIKITDMETCYKLVPSDEFKSLNLVEKRFGFEPEITAKLAKNKSLIWAEVPITYEARSGDEGKKIGWKDGFRAIWCILKYGWSKKR